MGIKTKRLLCVEDHLDTCELIANILREFDVVSVPTKKEALHHARDTGFDLIIVDYYLPDGAGDDLCREIRQFDENTPILFITASDDLSEKRSLSVGGQGMVKKGGGNFVNELRSRASQLA